MRHGHVHGPGHGGGIAGVSGHEPGLAQLAQRRLRAPAQLLIPPGHHHHRAFVQESAGNGEADACRAPGDQRVLALQPSRAAGHIHLAQPPSINEPASPGK